MIAASKLLKETDKVKSQQFREKEDPKEDVTRNCERDELKI